MALFSGLLLVLVALPVAVDWTTTLDTVHGTGRHSPADAVEVPGPVDLVTMLGLSLDKALVSRVPAPAIAMGRDTSAVVLDQAVLTHDAGRMSSPGRATPASRALARIAGTDTAMAVIRQGELRLVRANASPVVLTNVTAEISANGKGGGRIQALANYNQHRLEITAQWAPRPSTAGLEERVPLSLQVRANLVQVAFDGFIGWSGGKPRLEGETALKARKLRGLARWLGFPVAWSRDLRDFSASGRMEMADGVIAFARADVKIDGNEGSGALTLKTNGPRPSIDGTIGFDKLSLAPYVLSLLDRQSAASEAATAATLSTRSLLSLVDADLRLSAAKVVAPAIETGRGAATITLRDGRMQADLAELEVEGGRANGQVTVNMIGDEARLAIKGRVQDVDPGRIFTEALKRNPLLGRATITLDATGSGTTLPAILAQLHGKGAFAMKEGGRLGLDLRTLAYAAQSSPIVGWGAAGKGTTYLENLDGRYILSNGGIVIDTLVAKSNGIQYSGAGKIDVPDRLMDVALTLGTSTADGQLMREMLAFRGSWHDPAISLLRLPVLPAASAGAAAPAVTSAVRN